MFEKGRAFVKDHKKEIIVGGCIVVAGVMAGVLISTHTKINKRLIEIGKRYAGKQAISWDPGGGSMNLERVKEILDLNADNNSMFAIFREGIESDAYVCILLDDNVVIPELI